MKKADFGTYASLTFGVGGLAFFGGCTFSILSETMGSSASFGATLGPLAMLLFFAFVAYICFHYAITRIADARNTKPPGHLKWNMPIAILISGATSVVIATFADGNFGNQIFSYLFIGMIFGTVLIVLLILQFISHLTSPASTSDDKKNKENEKPEQDDGPTTFDER